MHHIYHLHFYIRAFANQINFLTSGYFPTQHARRLADLLRGHLQRAELLLRVARLLPRLQGAHHGQPGARRGQAVLQVPAVAADHGAGEGEEEGRRLPRGSFCLL